MSETIHWTKVTLRFFGENLAVDAIGHQLDLEPTEIYRKGEHFGANPRYAIHRENGWSWRVPCEKNVPIVEQLALLLVKLTPKQQEIHALVHQPGVTGDIMIGIAADVGNCDFYLPHEMLTVLGQLKLNLYPDFYPTTP